MTFSKVRAAAALLPVPRKHSCLSMLEGQHGKHACCPSHPLLVRAKTRQCCALSRSRCSGTPCNSWLLATCLETALRQSKDACLCWRGRRGESQGSSTFRWRRILLENSSKKQLSATVPWQTCNNTYATDLGRRGNGAVLGGGGFIQSLTHTHSDAHTSCLTRYELSLTDLSPLLQKNK